jgi:hypothetical protein
MECEEYPPMPRDEWTNTVSSGDQVDYTYEFEPDVGGVITSTKGIITHSMEINGPMTREQVEAEFRNIRIRADVEAV